jgi:hypothetical protein
MKIMLMRFCTVYLKYLLRVELHRSGGVPSALTVNLVGCSSGLMRSNSDCHQRAAFFLNKDDQNCVLNFRSVSKSMRAYSIK